MVCAKMAGSHGTPGWKTNPCSLEKESQAVSSLPKNLPRSLIAFRIWPKLCSLVCKALRACPSLHCHGLSSQHHLLTLQVLEPPCFLSLWPQFQCRLLQEAFLCYHSPLSLLQLKFFPEGRIGCLFVCLLTPEPSTCTASAERSHILKVRGLNACWKSYRERQDSI